MTVSFDEVTTIADLDELFAVLNGGSKPDFSAQSLASEVLHLIVDLCSAWHLQQSQRTAWTAKTAWMPHGRLCFVLYSCMIFLVLLP